MIFLYVFHISCLCIATRQTVRRKQNPLINERGSITENSYIYSTFCNLRLSYRKILSEQYWSLWNWHNLRLRCGSCKLFFDIISSCFTKFKNVVYSLEPGETPSYSKLCATFLNIAQYFKTLRCGCVYFFNLLKTSTVMSNSPV